MGFLTSSNSQLSPKLHSLSITQSGVGIPVPRLWGTNRLIQNLLWSGDFQSVAQQSPGSKGFGGKNSTSYDYLTALQGALCAGPISGINSIWASNGRLQQNYTVEPYTVTGSGVYTVTNAAKFAIDHGAARGDAYSVTANDYGSPGPIVYSGTQQTPMALVTGTPGAGQYTQASGVYTFAAADAGKTVSIAYSYSLYVLGELEDTLIPLTGPYEYTTEYANYFESDNGVVFVDTGIPLTVGSGPGQYTESGGNYFFNSANAGRPVAISYTWNNSQFETDPTSSLSLTVINGEQGQAPWWYMTTNHAAMALGYSGIATVCTPALDCGPSATIPQYNYEVAGPLIVGGGNQDANLADVIYDHTTNALWGVGFVPGWIGAAQLTLTKTYWAAAGFFGSPTIITQETAAETIQRWLDAGNCAGFASEGLLKILPYGDTTLVGNGATYTPQTFNGQTPVSPATLAPVVDLNDDDFLGDNADDPVQIVRQPRQDAYNHVRVQFNNRLNSYNAEIVDEFDQSAISKFGQRDESVQNYDFITMLTAATFSANIRIKRIQGIREQYKFTISGIRYWYLEPMDLVTLTDSWLGLNLTPVRIVEIEEDDKGNYEITAEAFPWGTATATLYPKGTNGGTFPTQAQAAPGNVNAPIMFEALDRLTGYNGYELWLGLSGNNPNWGGCRVWMSEDGTNYVPLTGTDGTNTQKGQCRMGVLTATLPIASSPDTTHTLSVDLATSIGDLQSVTLTQQQQLRTLCYLSTNELVSFETATLTSPYNYDLTNLIRGALGTTIASSPAGTQFLRLDSQPFTWKFDASQIGKTLYFKFTSFNLIQQNEQSLADVIAYDYTITGNFQGAISQNGGAYIGGSGSGAVTYNDALTYTSTATSLTVTGTVTLYMSNIALSAVVLPVSFTVTGLTAGTQYWLFPYAYQDAYDNWAIGWMQNGVNGITGAVGTPAAAWAGATSPILASLVFSQAYAKGSITPLSNNGMTVTLPVSGTGGGTGGGSGSCTVEGTALDTPDGPVDNRIIKRMFDEGKPVHVSGRYGPEAVIGADWVEVRGVFRVEAAGHTAFECSGSHTLRVAGHYMHAREITSGMIETWSGYEQANVRRVEKKCRVLHIQLAGPSHEYSVSGVWSHNARKA